MLFDKRQQIGGNCIDEIDGISNIRYHKYGPHIIHIKDDIVHSYLSEFEELDYYHHQVKAIYSNKIYDIPINLSTICNFFEVNLAPSDVEKFLKSKSDINIKEIRSMEDKCLCTIGKELYEAFFKEYTIKQWGKNPKDLPAETIRRIPIRNDFNNFYYNKPKAYLPKESYEHMFINMLDNKNISVYLDHMVTLAEIEKLSQKGVVIYTGALDALFNHKFGKLEYRELVFKKEYSNNKIIQGNSVINYPESKFAWTRITEPLYFKMEDVTNAKKGMIIKEYSKEMGTDGEPYYPINNAVNNNLYEIYARIARERHIIPAGRLGGYKYYDMEETIKSAISLASKIN